MMNHSTPTHDCAAYESLLPLLTTGLLTDDETRDLLAHADTCDHCRAQVDDYAALEIAGRRYYSPDAALPALVATLLTLDDIIQADASGHKFEKTAAVLVPSTPHRPRA
ncbi:MAG TPA: zf-HC2 domain-containing protein, partial [Ktedonobacterales bacterium]|nr:zf-HC2 domain-containing protein [Ktedonobacterales bacterium]